MPTAEPACSLCTSAPAHLTPAAIKWKFLMLLRAVAGTETALPLKTRLLSAWQAAGSPGLCRQALTLVSRQGRQAPLDQQLGGWGGPWSQHQPQVQGAVVGSHVHQALPPALVCALELVHGQGVEELVGDDDGGQVVWNVCQAAMPVHLQRTQGGETVGAWP